MIPYAETYRLSGEVDCLRNTDQGRNVLPKGADVHSGQRLAAAGEHLQEMARTQAIAALPKGQDHLPAGSPIGVQVLRS